jgi:hypothetical protein
VSGGPGLAALRLKEIAKGRAEDPLQRIGALASGERVLDATLGFAQDARVAARLVGPGGSVLGVEASLPLAVLTDASAAARALDDRGPTRRLGRAPQGVPVGERGRGALRPDVRRALAAQPGFEMLRRLANRPPLTPAVLADARRVAEARGPGEGGPVHADAPEPRTATAARLAERPGGLGTNSCRKRLIPRRAEHWRGTVLCPWATLPTRPLAEEGGRWGS